MGHSSIQITVDTYGHLIPGADIAWVDRLDSKSPSQQNATPAQPVVSGEIVEAMQLTENVGERGRNRTYNLLIKSQLLCQLSYAPGKDWPERIRPKKLGGFSNHSCAVTLYRAHAEIINHTFPFVALNFMTRAGDQFQFRSAAGVRWRMPRRHRKRGRWKGWTNPVPRVDVVPECQELELLRAGRRTAPHSKDSVSISVAGG